VCRSGSVSCANRDPVAGSAGMLRRLGCRVPAFPTLAERRGLASFVSTFARKSVGCREGFVFLQHDHPSTPARCGCMDKKGGQEAEGLGRSRGGFSTKLHLAAADEDTALALVLTAGQQHDATVVKEVLDAVPEACPVQAAVMDKAYDSDDIRATLRQDG